MTQETWIYKGSKKEETYLFVGEEGNFDPVPQNLLQMLGELDLILHLELTPERKLARANVMEVISGLQTQGYYLQLPPSAHGPFPSASG